MDFRLNSHFINNRASDNLIDKFAQGLQNATLSHDFYSKEVLKHNACAMYYKRKALYNLLIHNNTTTKTAILN